MGDNKLDKESLQLESFRCKTLEKIEGGKALAEAGLYYNFAQELLTCSSCEQKFSPKSSPDDIFREHKERAPSCPFSKQSKSEDSSSDFELRRPRSKTFQTLDSLRYEKERLATFISWPLKYPSLTPETLAQDGFYYLRTEDHVACAFCRGIIGAWEEGDTPRGEHKRHFPHCPFIRDMPVGNIPLAYGELLAEYPNQDSTRPSPAVGEDVCGFRSKTFPPTSLSKVNGLKKQDSLPLLGIPEYCGPKRKDFITKPSRLSTFAKWPSCIKQQPEEMADAGFFYCGLSDHVRCFHCGNGLRNWEEEDDPWKEHARWYPDCNYVLLTKGVEFVDKVRREKPPYIKTTATGASSSSPATKKSVNIPETELKQLMELDVMKAVIEMGFPESTVLATLKLRLQRTGKPFFSLEPCIDAVLQYMEEETKSTIENTNTVEEEAVAEQIGRLNTLTKRQEPHSTAVPESPSSPSLSQLPTLPLVSEPSVQTSQEPVPLPQPTSPQTQPEDEERMETESLPEVSAPSSSSQSDSRNDPMEVVTKAEEVMNLAEKILHPVASFGTGRHVVKEHDLSNESSGQAIIQHKILGDADVELERWRESRMCKVCMDADVEIVFLPCTHMVACSSCGVALTTCPICRQEIKYAFRPIVS